MIELLLWLVVDSESVQPITPYEFFDLIARDPLEVDQTMLAG
jgi:hypothetical protein